MGARQLQSCQIVEKFCFLSCFMLLSGLVHSQKEREREGERESRGKLATADTFVSTHVGAADINNSINCCTPKFCQREYGKWGKGEGGLRETHWAFR